MCAQGSAVCYRWENWVRGRPRCLSRTSCTVSGRTEALDFRPLVSESYLCLHTISQRMAQKKTKALQNKGVSSHRRGWCGPTMEAFSAQVTPKALTTMLIGPCLGQKDFIWGHSEGVLILQVDLPIRFHRWTAEEVISPNESINTC